MNTSNAGFLRKKRTVLILLPVVVITLFLLSLQVRSGVPNISTYTAQRGEFVIDIQQRGDLEAASKIMLSVPDNVYHRIRITRLVPDGSLVKKGDFLVQFDTSDAENRVTDREDELENAIGAFASTKARIESNMSGLLQDLKTQQYSYEQAEIQFEMMKYEAKTRRQVGGLNLKRAELSLKQAEAQVESQKIIDQADMSKADVRLKQAETRLNESKAQLNALTIIAPKDGIVVLQEEYNRSTRTREKIKVGDSPHRRMPLVSIPDLSQMIVKTKVNEVDIRKIKTEQDVIITLDALSGLTFNGVITNVAPLAHRNEGTDIKVFDVNVTIDNTDERVKPGMTAQCTIITERIPDQLFIPLDSVFEKEDTTVVYVKEGNFSQRAVNVGKKNSNFIVIENGLEAGEKVALRDPSIQLKKYESEEVATSSDAGASNKNH